MPNLSDMFSAGMLPRILVYGKPKTRKTWWAARAAEAGFNVILLDGDDGAHILANIDKQFWDKIQVISCKDDFGRPVFAPFVRILFDGKKFLWDDDARKPVGLNRPDPTHNHYEIDISKLTQNDVIIVDSWTALCNSVRYKLAKEFGVSLEDGERPEWDLFYSSGAFLDWVLTQCAALPCSLIVIAHEETYEKKKKETIQGKKVDVVEWTKLQPTSGSKEHGQKLAKHFSDILYFFTSGSLTKIDTSCKSDRDGGSRVLPPGIKNWDELQFAQVASACQLKRVAEEGREPAVKYLRANESMPQVNQQPASISGAATPQKIGVGLLNNGERK